MIKISDRLFWIPLYIFIVLFLIWKFRKLCWIMLPVLGTAIICSDLFASWFMKPLFERLRPCHDKSINYLLHLADGCGGLYGFISSHAANHFALATFLTVLLGKQYKWIWIVYIWAGIVSYSRIYLGAHYPGDVLTGALAGSLIAIAFYKLYLKMAIKSGNKKEEINIA
ncbi:MAG: phosphatase PAP2 family protein [Cytophagaceae bacterium]|nr:phosphatase PAP2 family protein [Cytophagaceae bacterium]